MVDGPAVPGAASTGLRNAGTGVGMQGGGESVTIAARRATPRAFGAWVIPLLASAATVALLAGFEQTPYVEQEALLARGVIVGAALWLLAVGHARNRALARHERVRLELVRARESLVAPVSDPATVIRTGWLQPAAWVLFATPVAVAATIRFVPDVEADLTAFDRTLLAAGAIGAIWLLALSGLASGWRRLAHRMQRLGAEGNTQLAEATLARLPVMISVCTPDGARSSMNQRYIDAMGRPADDLAGQRWMQHVHQTDRMSFGRVFGKAKLKGNDPIVVEYGVTTPGGENRWIREQFVPDRGADGALNGFIAAGIDITSQARNEAEHHEQIERLTEQLEERTLAAKRFEDEAESLRKKIEKHESDTESAKDRAIKAGEELKRARDAKAKAVTEAKEAKAAATEVKSENRRLTRLITKLETELEHAQREAATLAESHAKHLEQFEQMKAETTEARRQESQLRSKITRLTEHSQEQDDQIEALRESVSRAEDEVAKARVEQAEQRRLDMERFGEGAGARASGAFDAVARLCEAELADPQRDEVENAVAALEGLREMIAEACDSAPAMRSVPGAKRERAFDLRGAVRDAARMVKPLAERAGVTVADEIEAEFPASVYGDSLAVRGAIVRLAGSVASELRGGSLTLCLLHTGMLPSMVSVRIECKATGPDEATLGLRRALGLIDGDESAAGRFGAVWSGVAAAGGEHGCDVTDDGVVVWMTMSLMRRVANRPETPSIREAAAEQPLARATPIERAAPMQQAQTPRYEPPRLPQEGNTCNLGTVVELGQTSARVHSPRAISGGVTLRLTGAGGDSIEVPADVESCEKQGAKKFDALLRFPELPDALRASIRAIAMLHRRGRTYLLPGDPGA